MKKLFYTLAVVAVSTLFMGCPYSTKVNLEENPSEKVESKFLGTYEKKGSTTYNYVVSKKSNTMYTIEEIKNSDGKVSYTYDAYTTTIKGTQFLITSRVSSSTYDQKYYIYKFEGNEMGTIFTLSELSENITEEFTSASELKDFISKYKDLSFFYNKTDLKFYKTE